MWICPICGDDISVLGTLGYLVHGRCRGCGIQVSTEVEPDDYDGWADYDDEDGEES